MWKPRFGQSSGLKDEGRHFHFRCSSNLVLCPNTSFILFCFIFSFFSQNWWSISFIIANWQLYKIMVYKHIWLLSDSQKSLYYTHSWSFILLRGRIQNLPCLPLAFQPFPFSIKPSLFHVRSGCHQGLGSIISFFSLSNSQTFVYQ